ncbi:ribosome-recycling factor [Ceratobasidium sp. AG-Ba]|nr:ribosome-recycling factor [Ceratobasidium sp. AG-Ba]QRW10788.1 ribosome-recycling factor [Ceratobasidium sp. AG-Ba]
MSSLLIRLALRSRASTTTQTLARSIPSSTVLYRSYAKNHRKGASSVNAPVPDAVDTHTDFAPPRGSKRHKSQHEDITPTALSEEDEVIQEAGRKMDGTVQWYKRELAQMETRVSGRVMPSLLDPVRVKLKGSEGAGSKLDEVATVGVRDGNVLVITVFDEANLKYVESSIVDAQIPNMIPQRADSRTLKIPVPKPTMEARQSVATAAARQAEDAKVKIRTSRESGMKQLKKMGYDKNSKPATDMQKATDHHTKEIDTALAKLKKLVAA